MIDRYRNKKNGTESKKKNGEGKSLNRHGGSS